MNRDQIMIGVCVGITIAIFFFFQTMRENQRMNENIRPIKESIIASKRPRLINFSAPWCGACQQFKPVIKKVMANYASSVDCQMINIDDKQNAKLVRSFGVSAIPATYVFDRKANLVMKQIGYMEPDDLDKYLRKAVF